MSEGVWSTSSIELLEFSAHYGTISPIIKREVSMTFFKRLVLPTLFLPFIGEAKSPSFTGLYGGGTIGYRNTSATIISGPSSSQKSYRFSGGGEVFEGFIGHGKSWKRLYLGYEVTFGMNTGKIKKGALSLSNRFQFGLAARIGAPMNDSSIMPHFGLALEARQMKFKSTSSKGFYSYSIAPLLGGTLFINDEWLFRAELGYYMNLKNTGIGAGYSFGTPPSSLVLKGSVIYKINPN